MNKPFVKRCAARMGGRSRILGGGRTAFRAHTLQLAARFRHNVAKPCAACAGLGTVRCMPWQHRLFSLHQELPMNPTVLSPELEAQARKRVKARLGWMRHAAIYCAVISGLALLGAWQGRHWPLAPALGWGFGLLVHGLAVHGAGLFDPWRERLLQAERSRLAERRQPGAGA
jgi:hypothetical protein